MSDQLHTIHLKGCSPTPLAHYLKALGILRLVAEQVDVSAVGWWKNDSFWLRNHFTNDTLGFVARCLARLPRT